MDTTTRPHRARPLDHGRSSTRSLPATTATGDATGHVVRFRDDRRLDVDGITTARFSRIEYALLIALAAADGAVVGRRSLLDAVWGSGHAGVARVVDVRVGRIRAKLRGVRGPVHLVDTVHGRGYRFAGRIRGALPVAPTGVLLHGWTIPHKS